MTPEELERIRFITYECLKRGHTLWEDTARQAVEWHVISHALLAVCIGAILGTAIRCASRTLTEAHHIATASVAFWACIAAAAWQIILACQPLISRNIVIIQSILGK